MSLYVPIHLSAGAIEAKIFETNDNKHLQCNLSGNQKSMCHHGIMYELFTVKEYIVKSVFYLGIFCLQYEKNFVDAYGNGITLLIHKSVL